jgi:hypothetical protein
LAARPGEDEPACPDLPPLGTDVTCHPGEFALRRVVPDADEQVLVQEAEIAVRHSSSFGTL